MSERVGLPYPPRGLCREDAALDWRPIKTAPKDGRWILAKIPGHGSNNAIAWMEGLSGSGGEPAGGWCFMSEQEPPDCWTDGVCWEVNEDGKPSVQPTEWKRLTPSPDRREPKANEPPIKG